MISEAKNSLFKLSIQNGKSNLWFEHEKNSELGSPLAKSLIWNEVVKSGGMSLPKRTLPKNTHPNVPSRISLKIVESLIWDEVVESGGMKGSLPKRTLPKIPTQICPPELVWK